MSRIFYKNLLPSYKFGKCTVMHIASRYIIHKLTHMYIPIYSCVSVAEGDTVLFWFCLSSKCSRNTKGIELSHFRPKTRLSTIKAQRNLTRLLDSQSLFLLCFTLFILAPLTSLYHSVKEIGITLPGFSE